jgi:hypothetical protein
LAREDGLKWSTAGFFGTKVYRLIICRLARLPLVCAVRLNRFFFQNAVLRLDGIVGKCWQSLLVRFISATMAVGVGVGVSSGCHTFFLIILALVA